MASITRRPFTVDTKLPRTGGGGAGGGGDGTPGSGGAIPAPGAPQLLRLVGSAVLVFSAVTPKAAATVAWLPPVGIAPDDYLVQWAIDSGFTNPVSLLADKSQFASFGIPDLPVASTIYVRVAARARKVQGTYSNTLSFSTPNDTTAPSPPGLPAAAFLADGSLQISWQKPASPNFKSVEVRIWNSAAKTVEYDLIAEADGTTYTWTAARNRQQTVGSPDGSPDKSVYVELRARSWGGIYSTTVNASATAALPANVTGASATWDGAAGSCRFTWNTVAGAVAYRLTIDGVARTIADTQYLYDLATNRQEHSGTPDPALSWSIVAIDALDQVSATPASGTATLARPATPGSVTHAWSSDTGTAPADWWIDCAVIAGVVKRQLTIDGVTRDHPVVGRINYDFDQNASDHIGAGDPVLSYSLVWVDALGQTSTTPASGTATNAAPPATTLTAFGAFSQVVLNITASAAADLRDYRVRVYRNSSLVRTLFFVDPRPTYAVEDGSGSYTFDVAPRDRFNQIGTASAQTSATTLTDLSQYVADLRSGLLYSDSLATAATTLAALKDADLATNVVTYPSGTSWAWTQGDWQEEITHQTIELSLGTAASVYVGVSSDGTSWSWFYGGTPAGGAWATTTSTTTESTAQAGAATLSAGTWRIDLNSPRRCRYIRIGHRNTGSTYALREFFPSTLIRGTYVQAESITTVNLAANSVVADKVAAGAITAAKISVTDLSAISANIGSITAGTITGVLVRTASSGQRVEMSSTGLRTYDSGGNVVIEASTATNGALHAGSGRVRLNRNQGIQHVHPASNGTFSPLDMLRSDAATAIGQLEAAISVVTGENTVTVRVFNPAGTTNGGTFSVVAGAAVLPTTTISAGLNVGTASGAGTGQVWASASGGGDYLVLLGNDPPAGLRGVSMRYRSDIDRAVIASVHQGTSLKPLQFAVSALSFADGVTPVARQTAAGAATDLASVITLANSLRGILINLGLAQ